MSRPRKSHGRPAQLRLDVHLDVDRGLRGPSRAVILRLVVRATPRDDGRQGWAVDRDLVLRAQRGEEAAFAALLREVADRLHATAHHILRDRDLAADAVQQAMIEMWRKIRDLREPDRFLSWAYRIVVRAAYAEAERTRRTRDRVEPETIVTTADVARAVDDRDELDRAFGRLSQEHRTVLVLKHYAGLSNPEIAGVLAVPEGTVRSRLHHGLAALRAALEADRRSATAPA